MANRGKIPTPKTQREILNSQIEPYNPPPGSPGFSSTGNPNNANTPNRANQVSFRDDNTKPFSLSFGCWYFSSISHLMMGYYYFQYTIFLVLFQPYLREHNEFHKL